MSTREIEAHLRDIYGVEVSARLINQVTDGVMDEVRVWQSRPLAPLYMIVYLDALVVKMRHEGPFRVLAIARSRFWIWPRTQLVCLVMMARFLRISLCSPGQSEPNSGTGS